MFLNIVFVSDKKKKYKGGELIRDGGDGNILIKGEDMRGNPCVIKMIDYHENQEIDIAGILMEKFPKGSKYLLSPLDLGEFYNPQNSRKEFFIIYEYMNGDLSKYLFISIDEILTAIRDIFEGLKLLHKAGLAHNDLKTANLLYKREKGGKTNFKIGDFGTICSGNPNYGLICEAYSTPMFGAPETIKKFRQRVNLKTAQKSDIFSIGIVAYVFVSKMLNIDYRTNYPKLPYDYDVYLKEIKEKIYFENKTARGFKQSEYYRAEFKIPNKENKTLNFLNQIINWCMTVNLERRPTAKQVVEKIDAFQRGDIEKIDIFQREQPSESKTRKISPPKHKSPRKRKSPPKTRKSSTKQKRDRR